MGIFEHAGVWCGRKHGALVDRRCDKQLLQGVSGSLPLRPPSRYSCVAGVLAHLHIHARGAGTGLYGGRGAVHAVGGADGGCVSEDLLTMENGALWREREEEE